MPPKSNNKRSRPASCPSSKETDPTTALPTNTVQENEESSKNSAENTAPEQPTAVLKSEAGEGSENEERSKNSAENTAPEQPTAVLKSEAGEGSEAVSTSDVQMVENDQEGGSPSSPEKNSSAPALESDASKPTTDPPPEPTSSNTAIENETEIVPDEKKPPKRARKPKKETEDKPEIASKPTKPPNAYMLFYKDELKKDAYTGIALPERAKMIGAMWREMDDAARAPFQERVAKAKAVTA